MSKECACCGFPGRTGNHYCTRCGIALEKGEAPRAVLGFLKGRRQWGERVVTNRSIQIGRGEFCEILLNDPLVSEIHARIVYSDGSFWIEDLGSRNGTYVNGSRIERKSILKNGFLVRLGSSMLRFEQHPSGNMSST
jgi:pSer/pThr/pTyr-binding forkhead associated (FHA) protein